MSGSLGRLAAFGLIAGAGLGLASKLLDQPKSTRRVFFSFHYQRDIWRVQQVKNHWLT